MKRIIKRIRKTASSFLVFLMVFGVLFNSLPINDIFNVFHNLTRDWDVIDKQYLAMTAKDIVDNFELGPERAYASGTRAKTVEYFLYNYDSSATNLSDDTTILSPGTIVNLPESSVSVVSAFVDFKVQNGTLGTAIDAYTMRFGRVAGACGAPTMNSRLAASGLTAPVADGAESKLYDFRVDVTSDFSGYTGGSDQCVKFDWNISRDMGVLDTTAEASFQGANAKLIITYNYDDTSATQLNTIYYPIEATTNQGTRATQLAASSTADFAYNTTAPELTASVNLKSQFFEVNMRAGNSTTTTDASWNFCRFSGTCGTSTGLHYFEEALSLNAGGVRYLVDALSGFTYNDSGASLRVTSSASSVANFVGGTNVMTYNYAKNAATKTKTVRYGVGEIITAAGSGTKSALTGPTVILREGGIAVQKAWFRVETSSSAADTLTLTTKVGANAETTADANDAYVYATNTIEAGQANYINHVIPSADYATMNTNAKSGIATQIAADWTTGGGSVSGELFITYTYTDEFTGWTDSRAHFAGQSTANGATTYTTATGAINPAIPDTGGTVAINSQYIHMQQHTSLATVIANQARGINFTTSTCTPADSSTAESTALAQNFALYKSTGAILTTNDATTYTACASSTTSSELSIFNMAFYYTVSVSIPAVTSFSAESDPGNSTIAPGGAITAVNGFTLTTNTGTDAITNITVNLSTNSGVGTLSITDNADTLLGSIGGGTGAGIITGSNSIPISSTNATVGGTQFKVKVTPLSHANMAVPDGGDYAITGLVTDWTGTNVKAGNGLGNDASSTVTIDNNSPEGSPFSGIITGDATSIIAEGIAIDSTYMYVAGRNSGTDWRIEKRLLSTGSLDSGFGTNGVITSNVGGDEAYAIAIDSTYMYVVGTGNYQWRIEKRLLSTGAVDNGFGTNGVITGAALSTYAQDIAIDSTYMYVAGRDLNSNFRIEKRLLSTGAVDNGFGTNGVITGDATSIGAEAIAIDSTYMYVAGRNSGTDWRIEKRLLSTGAVDNGFGTNGVITGAAASNTAYAIAIDSTYMYVGGHDGADSRIEKRLLSTGAVDNGFGTNGVITGAAASNGVNDIAIDSTYMYVVGNDSTPDLRIEKRLLSTGAVDNGFGTNGVITGAAASEYAYAIAIDSTYMYLAGSDVNSDWRIEKRLLSTGELGVTPTTVTVGDSQVEVSWPNPADVDFQQVYIYCKTSTILSGDTPAEGTDPAVDGTACGATAKLKYKGVASPQTISGLTNGTLYYFRIYARDTNGNFTAYASTQEVSATPSANLVTTVAATGTQTASVAIPTANKFVGGAFTLTASSGSVNVTSTTITVNSATGLSNMKLYTDTVASCTTADPVTNATLFGSNATVGATTVITGSAAVTTTPRCLYVVVDVGSTAADAQTLEISLNASTDVTMSSGTKSGTFPVAVTGTTTLQATTTLSTGTNPGNSTIAPSGAITSVNGFTLTTSSGTDAITAVTVNLSTNSGVGTLSITDNADTLLGSIGGGIGTGIITGSNSIPISSTNATVGGTQFKVKVTPLSHANMAVPDGGDYAITGVVTDWTGTKPKAGQATDTSSTVTIDNNSPATATLGFLIPGDTTVSVGWNPTGDPDYQQVYIYCKTSTVLSGDTPAEGTDPLVDGTACGATAKLKYKGVASPQTISGLTNGTLYYFRIYARDTNGNFTAYASTQEASATPVAPAVIISGTIYSNEVPTAYNCSTGNVIVRVAKNGTLAQSVTCTAAGGTYTLPGVTGAVAGDILTVFIDDATASKQGSIVTKVNDGTTPLTLNLYQQRVVVRNESTGDITNTNMGAYDSANNANIKFTESAGALTIAALNKLIIWTGDTFTPGGTVTTTASATSGNPDGDVLIQAGATLSMGTSALSVGGDFTNSGTFSYGAGQTTTFTATGTGFVIEDGANNFDTLIFNGAGGGWTLGSAVTTVGNLTITAGNLTMPAFAYTIGGATSITGTLTISSATGAKAFTGDVTVNAGGTWNNSGNSAIGLSGNLTNNQTFTAGSGVYTMSGTSKTITGTIAIPSLTISGTTQNNGTLTVSTALAGASTLTNGSGATLNLGGTSGITTLIPAAAANTINYTGGIQTVKVPTTNPYWHLGLSGSGAKTLTSIGALSGNLTMAGSASTSGLVITTIGGNVDLSGTAQMTTGATLNVTGTTTVATGASLTNGSLYTLTSPNVTITGTGLLTNNGTVTASASLGGTGGLTNGATGTLNIGFASAPSITTLTATVPGNTVNYTATDPNCKVTSYHHLNFTGSGAITCAVTTVGGDLGLSGTVSWATTSNINVGGTTTVGNGTSLTNGVSYTLTSPNVTVTGTGLFTNNGTVTISTSLGGGSFTNGLSGTLNIGFASAPTITTLTTTASGNTVNYTAATPNCKVTSYHHLNFTGSGAVTCAVTTVGGNLGLSGTAIWSTTSSINVAGTFTNNSSGAITNNNIFTVTTGLAGSGNFINSGTGTLNIGFASAPAITTLTATASGNTVSYTATAPSCKVASYHHLNFTGSGAVTCGVTTVGGDLGLSGTAWTPGGNLVVGGNLSVGNGSTLTQGGFTLGVTGNTTIGGGSSGGFVGSGSPLTLSGNLTLNSNSTWTKGAGTVTFNKGEAQTITDSTGTQDLGNVVTATALTVVSTNTNIKLTSLNIAGSTTWNIADDTMTITGSNTPLTVGGTFTTGGSTVIYNHPTSATVTPTIFNNLTLGGTGTYTMPATNITLRGNLTIGSGANVTKGNGIIIFAIGGGSTQTITDSSGNNPDIGAIKISANVSNSTLNLGSSVKMTSITIDPSQVFVIGANTLTLTGSTPFDLGIVGTASTGSTIVYMPSQASGIVNLPGALTYYNVQFNKALNIFEPVAGNIVVNNNLDIIAGTLELNTNDPSMTVTGITTISGTLSASSNSNNPLTIKGNFINNGIFNNNNGKIVIDSISDSLLIGGSSVTNFYDFTSIAPGKTIQFKNNQDVGFAGTLTITGGSRDYINLYSDSPGIPWKILLTGSANLTFVRLLDAGCGIGTGSIYPHETVSNSGNNDGGCWKFIGKSSGGGASGGGSGGGGEVGGGGGGGGSGGSEGGGGGGESQGGGTGDGGGVGSP